MRRVLSTYIMLWAMLSSFGAFGNELPKPSEDQKLLGDKFKLSFDGEINYNFFSDPNKSGAIHNLKGSYIRFEAVFNQFVKAVVMLNLEHALKEGKLKFNNKFDLDDWIEQAYVKVTRDIGGKQRALIIGKQPIPFGTNMVHRPLYNESALYNLQNIEGVFGLTVDLGENFLNFFDEAMISAFAAEGTSFKIDSASFKLKKYILDNWMLTLSHAEIGKTDAHEKRERRTTIGLTGFSEDGDMVAWIEGTLFSNNPEYPNSNYAISIGLSKKIHKGVDAMLEYNHIENELNEYLVGLRVALSENWLLGVQGGYQQREKVKSGAYVGISLTYAFGSDKDRRLNDDWLFKEDEFTFFEDKEEQLLFEKMLNGEDKEDFFREERINSVKDVLR